MIYHYVITISVWRRTRWLRRSVRDLHTTSGHAKVPGPHTELNLYNYILAEAVKAADANLGNTAVIAYRLAPELATDDPEEQAER